MCDALAIDKNIVLRRVKRAPHIRVSSRFWYIYIYGYMSRKIRGLGAMYARV